MNVGTSIYKKKDSHLVYVDGKIYAGMHYLVDMWGICNEESTNKINDLLLRAARAAKATVLYQHAYHFGEGLGISAIALLAESHISVHTWPEKSYAAFDIFMCGKTDPNLSLNLLKKLRFSSKNIYQCWGNKKTPLSAPRGLRAHRVLLRAPLLHRRDRSHHHRRNDPVRVFMDFECEISSKNLRFS